MWFQLLGSNIPRGTDNTHAVGTVAGVQWIESLLGMTVDPGWAEGGLLPVPCLSPLPCPQVTITVLDENDNSPQFDITSDSSVSVAEDSAVGKRVAVVLARDPDAGSNGQVGSPTQQVWERP